MAAIKPQEIAGKSHKGYALNLHTLARTRIGVDEFGHDQFDTTYSELGSLLHRLKYKYDHSVVAEIASTVADFLKPSPNKLDLLVPVPPSKQRTIQPVLVLATAIGSILALRLRLLVSRPVGRRLRLKTQTALRNDKLQSLAGILRKQESQRIKMYSCSTIFIVPA